MSKNLTLLMLENQTYIIQLIGRLTELPGYTAKLVVDAVIPLLKVSPAIRDNLILNLRKSMWGRTLETRQMAVTGFLTLLKSVKVNNLAAFSDSGSSSGSTYSFFTQLSIDCRAQQYSNKFNNEALCLEVLSTMKRCFFVEIEVRTKFYDGLFEAVCVNSELCIPVLDLLWTHFSLFYIFEEEMNSKKLPPLEFCKLTMNKNAEDVFQVK